VEGNQLLCLRLCLVNCIDDAVELALVDLAYHPPYLRPRSHAEGDHVPAPEQRRGRALGHVELLGKPTGMDLRDGNPSLPIILALNEGQTVVREAFERSHPTEGEIAMAIEAIKAGPAIRQAKTLSKDYAEEALKSIKRLPPSPYRNGLKTMVQLIIDRDF